MKKIQFIGVTPEQLLNALSEGLQSQLEGFKEHFQPKEPTEYLTRKEVAQMLKINLSTLHHWVKAKKLKAYSISNRVYFKRTEVEQAIIHFNK